MEQNFKIGDWLYYLGEEGGGHDTGPNHWHKGVIGQLIKNEGVSLRLHNILNPDTRMKTTCSNCSTAFRLATPEEIQQLNPNYKIPYYEIY